MVRVLTIASAGASPQVGPTGQSNQSMRRFVKPIGRISRKAHETSTALC